MYRCTDCFKEYKVCPEYCDCGNDEFDQIEDIQQPIFDDFDDDFNDNSFSDNYPSEEIQQRPRQMRQRRRSVVPKQIRPKKKTIKKNDKIGMAIGAVLAIIGVILFFTIGSGQEVQKKKQGPLLQKDYSIPTDVEPFWDSAPPSGTVAKIKTYTIV